MSKASPKKNNHKKRNWIIVVIVVLIIGMVGYYYKILSGKETQVQQPVYQPITVKRNNIEIAFTTDGQASALVENLNFATSGTVKEIAVRVGDVVSVGDMLAKLDEEKLQEQINQAQANYNKTVADYKQVTGVDLATKDAVVNSNAEQLDKQNDIYNTQVTNAQNNYDAAIKKEEEALADLKEKKSDLENDLTALKEDQTALAEDLETLAAELTTLEATIPVNQEAVASKENAIDAKETAIDNNEKAIANTEEAIKDVKVDIKEQEADIATTKHTEQDKVNATIASEQQKVTTVEGALTTAQKQRDQTYGSRNASAETVNANLAVLKTAQQNLKDAILHAPANGVIAEINYAVGETVTQNQTKPFAKLQDSKQPVPQVEVFAEEGEAVKISKDMAVKVAFDLYDGEDFAGKVQFLSPIATIDQNDYNTYQVLIDLIDPQKSILDGMLGEVRFITKEVPNVIVIPIDAVYQQNGVTVVTVVTNQENQTRTVETGFTDGKVVEIKSGLEEGEQVLSLVQPS
ncbi:MAG: hypothetical protein A2233_03370 [Candidatus Kerfeldbacteria bacterium RIFOXYA2_FULL_38_24]|uniref:CzcB-like C-terminal circularly permuted SH3-like domain-containing protein n=1 Tax=Candidatus Kerfeldbacteria bacterium RIFOXYB2_FULL_38_14 TaxID=1798547 RepID=A0A1G2B931_9BACT|nr:MAG: hypothetical protein A2233_03370 [Candidatus Kerfeldbacteria bacterium RIFOXYA2_FULL_38_24]OGY85632.1 MAG: hypothetical protein A2319_02610 [Candidatus Kerfeldbacteria bacterium RIFOXYB2_FULL_38_14]OGY89346.1 MAG: hypothetical protein A2458_00455 [Candidatus Kerfeldbacteria bacterium RIFOXYC2_FULL_38_9]